MSTNSINIQNINIYKEKILKQYYFEKHYIRKNINEKIFLTDNNNSFNNVFILTKNSKIGKSIQLNSYFLENKYNKSLRLELLFNLDNLSVTENTFKTLKVLKEKNFLRTSLITQPVKGGFKVYSSGIYGFLPKSQFKEAWNNMLNFSKKNVLKMHEYKKYLPLRIELKTIKITPSPAYKKRNFLNTRSYKRYKSTMNVVFGSKFLKKK